jgi:hypothetical protein
MDLITKGAVRVIYNDQQERPEFNSAVVQVLQVKKLNTGNLDRYR